MWTRRPSKCAATSRAFTLIELLVVVAIIGLLVSILLPSLCAARAQARRAVCGTLLRGLGVGLQGYGLEQQDWIPGVNTSGVALRVLGETGAESDYVGKGLPAQSWDFITPWLSQEIDVGANRAEKFQTLLTQYRCPAQAGFGTIFWPPGLNASPDRRFFQESATFEWTAMSYLMPAYFQYWGQRQAGRRLADMKSISFLPVSALAADPSWEVTVPDYESRFTRVGRMPDRKIAIADGTRYVDGESIYGDTVDFDPSPHSNAFGAFGTQGAFWQGSRAYGVRSGTETWWEGRRATVSNPSNGVALQLSYRHGCERGSADGGARSNKGTINALFFDGHVAPLADRQSREPEFWYPSGAIVNSPNQGMLQTERGEVIR